MLRGAGELIEICKHRIHHDPFHLSGDGDFSWEEVECLGACVNAPMAMIWKDTYEDLDADSFNKLLDGFSSGRPPKPGPQNGRQFAAPEGGPRVLKEGGHKPANTNQPGGGAPLQDADAKSSTESASERESPAPKAPAADASKNAPPSGDPTPKASGGEAGTAAKPDTPKGSAETPAKGPKTT
jgi:NADH-quinone oxidoreductase subunit E